MKQLIKKLIRKFALWLLSWIDMCPICHHSWLQHSCPTTHISLVQKKCSVCGRELPVDAIKTHTGQYRCRDHK